jgi:hypothetical protein
MNAVSTRLFHDGDPLIALRGVGKTYPVANG